MPDRRDSKVPFATVAMAKILLDQDMVEDALEVIEQLESAGIDDPRIQTLRGRMTGRLKSGEFEEEPGRPVGADRVELVASAGELNVEWELTDDGLALAKRRVRFSGKVIVRLFTADCGARGVRTRVRDLTVESRCAKMSLSGLPPGAVFVAAVGFLGNSGVFVPLARALPCAGSS